MKISLALVSLYLGYASATAECGKDLVREKLITTPALCSETALTADCLAKVDVTNVGRTCLSHIAKRDEVLSSLGQNSAAQIMSSKLLDIPEDPKLMAALFKRNDWVKNKAEPFLSAAAANRDYSNAIMDGLPSDPEYLAHFFIGANAAQHTSACAKMTKDVIPYITTTFFAKMSRKCFKDIPAEAFEGFDSVKFGAVRADLLREISIAQAAKIPNHAFSGMNAEQIKQWGVPYSPPDASDKDALKTYTDAHPCSQAKRMMATVKPELRRNLRTQCKLEDSASKGKAEFSAALLGASVLIALYNVFM